MLLSLNKRFAVVTIFVALIFTLMPSTAKADDQKPQDPAPKKEEVAPPAPSQPVAKVEPAAPAVEEKLLDVNAPTPIVKTGEIIKNFKAKIDTDDQGVGTLTLSGLIHKDCAEHIAVRMDEFDEDKRVYPVRIVFYNYKSQGGKDVAHSCTVEKTRGCDRYNCMPINEAVNGLGKKVVTGFNTTLERTGKVKIRIDDLRYEEGDPEAIKDTDIVNGGLEYLSVQTLADLAEREERAERKAEMMELCKQAKAGNKSAYERLTDMGANPDLLNKLGPIVLEKEMADLEAAIDKSASLKDLKGLIGEIKEFGMNNEQMRGRAARAMETLAEKAMDAETDSERETSINKNIHNQFVTAESALKEARKLAGGKDVGLRVKLNNVKMNHATWASNTGDEFYRNIANKTMNSAYRDVKSLANQTKDPDVASLRKTIEQKMKRRALDPLYSQDGYVIAGMVGNELDQNFVKANNQGLGINDQISQLLGSNSNYWMPQGLGDNGRF